MGGAPGRSCFNAAYSVGPTFTVMDTPSPRGSPVPSAVGAPPQPVTPPPTHHSSIQGQQSPHNLMQSSGFREDSVPVAA